LLTPNFSAFVQKGLHVARAEKQTPKIVILFQMSFPAAARGCRGRGGTRPL